MKISQHLEALDAVTSAYEAQRKNNPASFAPKRGHHPRSAKATTPAEVSVNVAKLAGDLEGMAARLRRIEK